MGILYNAGYVKAAQKKKKNVMKLMGFKSAIQIFLKWEKKITLKQTSQRVLPFVPKMVIKTKTPYGGNQTASQACNMIAS